MERFLNGDGGSLASALRAYGSVGEMRAATPLPVDAQRLIDKAVIEVGLDRLTIVEDLIAAKLVRPLPEWLSVMSLYQPTVGRAGHAQRSMKPLIRGERQVQDRGGRTIPIFCTGDNFSFEIREILAGKRAGTDLETSHVKGATRNVNEAFEDQAINGAGFNVNGNSAPGLLNAPNANTYAYIDGEAWTASGHSGEDIFADVQAMMALAAADGYPGPYNFYYPTAYGGKINTDYKAANNDSIVKRLRELEAGGRPINFRQADKLPANRTILVQMTDDVIDVVYGQAPTAVTWSPNPYETRSNVLGCIIVRPKTNIEGGSGIVLGNLT